MGGFIYYRSEFKLFRTQHSSRVDDGDTRFLGARAHGMEETKFCNSEYELLSVSFSNPVFRLSLQKPISRVSSTEEYVLLKCVQCICVYVCKSEGYKTEENRTLDAVGD